MTCTLICMGRSLGFPSTLKARLLHDLVSSLTECLKDAPLQTVEELLHTVYPETKEWCFDSTRNSDGTDPDADIWKELLWSNTHKKRMEPLPQPNEETSKRVLVAVQPSCVLTEQDMVDFVWALNVREMRFARNLSSQPFDLSRLTIALIQTATPFYSTWECLWPIRFRLL